MPKKSQYALYKGDKYIFGGTREEIAKYLGVKPNTVSFYSKPAYLKRIKNIKDRYEVMKVDDD